MYVTSVRHVGPLTVCRGWALRVPMAGAPIVETDVTYMHGTPQADRKGDAVIGDCSAQIVNGSNEYTVPAASLPVLPPL